MNVFTTQEVLGETGQGGGGLGSCEVWPAVGMAVDQDPKDFQVEKQLVALEDETRMGKAQYQEAGFLPTCDSPHSHTGDLAPPEASRQRC